MVVYIRPWLRFTRIAFEGMESGGSQTREDVSKNPLVKMIIERVSEPSQVRISEIGRAHV